MGIIRSDPKLCKKRLLYSPHSIVSRTILRLLKGRGGGGGKLKAVIDQTKESIIMADSIYQEY